jgi:signal peptide peptidase SppA
MDLTDFRKGQLWGIQPTYFESLQRRFFESMQKLNSGELSGKLAEKVALYDRKKGIVDLYELRGDVAILSINGPLTKRPSFWSFFFGGSSYQDVEQAMTTAIGDPNVKAIVLDVDSPGGVVNGVESIATKIFEARDEKPIVTFANGLMASAAYWIGSAAEVVVGAKTSEVGSIGVLMTHVDYSQFERNIGIKTTYLSAGEYKTLGNDSEPLSDKAREVFQAELDKIYSVFVDTVADNRATTADDVRERMADGRVFVGTDAVDAGLIDEIGSLESAIETARSMIDDDGDRAVVYVPRGASATLIDFETNNDEKRGFFIMNDDKQIKISDLTLDMLAAENPGLVKQISEAAKNDAEEKFGDRMKQSADDAAAETGRIVGLAKVFFGEDKGAKFEKVVDSGITVEQFEAVNALNPDEDKKADDGKRDEMLDAIKDAGANDIETGGDVSGGTKDFMAMVSEYQRANNCKYTEALLAVRKAHPDAHSDYIKKVN